MFESLLSDPTEAADSWDESALVEGIAVHPARDIGEELR